MTTKLTNEYGYKGNKYQISITLTTTCDTEHEITQAMTEFGCNNPMWHLKNGHFSELNVSPELQKLVSLFVRDNPQFVIPSSSRNFKTSPS
jgi:hypothetical protein